MDRQQRLWYIDNLRIFLISLVVLHHLAITYGAPGGWYYNESQGGMPEIIPLSMFVAANQSFFMGMFFFISAFFILPSLQRKGTKRFIRERLVRLGIPLLVFFFFISPLTVFVLHKYIQGREVTFFNYLFRGYGTGFGPMWFVEALLLFTFLFLLVRPFASRMQISFPATWKILVAAVIAGLLQFIIRIWLPVGWSMPFTSFQLPFFIQYIFLFGLGIIAWQNNWLDSVRVKNSLAWLLFAQVLILLVFPLLFLAGNAAEEGSAPFMGGFTWQSFSYALWEQVLGFALIAGLLGLFKAYFNRQGQTLRFLSGSAYAVYVTHAFVLVTVSACFVSWQVKPTVKLVVLAPLVLILCFAFAGLLHKIPLIKKVL